MLNAEAALKAMEEQVAGAECIDLTSMEPTETVLCVIDINNGFAIEGPLSSPRVKEKIGLIAATAEACLEKDIDVLAYTDCHPEDAGEFGAYPAHCMAGTDESELVDELKVFESKGLRVVKKNSTNGVLAFNPAESGKYRNYVINGCVTDICVYQFAVTLRAYLNEHQLQGEVYVIEDQVQTFHIDGFHHGDLMHITFLKSLMDNGVKVVRSLTV